MVDLKVARAVSVTSGTGGSFEEELRGLLRNRARLLFGLALLGAALVMVVVKFVLGLRPVLEDGLLPPSMLVWAGHLTLFGMALIAVHLFNFTARGLQRLCFLTLALNLVVATFHIASNAPDMHPFIVTALTLFGYAAIIPSRAYYTAGLAVLAIAAFVLAPTLNYAFVPQAQAFWAERGGVEALRTFVILGVTGIGMFGLVAYVTSRTLYTLRKTAHEAQRLGNYLIEEELGSGGMGRVFKAQHALIRRPTAVKVMQVSGEQAQSALVRFEREVQLSATLTHPNTITIYDFGHTPDNRFYYVMEYLEGLDLQKLVERFGPLRPARAVFILKQVCSALAEAHERGIVHRDIKPSNIFLTERGGFFDYVKVLDFGLAKQVTAHEASGVTQTGIAVGTPHYISPEAIQGGATLDGRSDLYCLGAVAYWMVTGRPPFDAPSSVELLIDHVKSTPLAPSKAVEVGLPPALDAIVMKCLEKRPNDRFQNAADLEDALSAVEIADTWDYHRAREWWSLHGLVPSDGLASGVRS